MRKESGKFRNRDQDRTLVCPLHSSAVVKVASVRDRTEVSWGMTALEGQPQLFGVQWIVLSVKRKQNKTLQFFKDDTKLNAEQNVRGHRDNQSTAKIFPTKYVENPRRNRFIRSWRVQVNPMMTMGVNRRVDEVVGVGVVVVSNLPSAKLST